MCRQVISSIEIIIEKISNRLFLKCLWSSSVQNMHFGVSGCSFPLSCRGRTIREMTRDVFVFQVTDQMKWYWKMCCFAYTSRRIVTALMVVQMNLWLQQLDWVSNRAHSCSNMWLISSAATSLERDALTYGFQRTQCWVLLSFSSKLDSWGCGVIYIPLRPVDFCINLIKTRVGVHSSLGPVFNVNMNHVVAPLILSDDSRSVSPDTSPPKVHHISRPVFPPEVLFLLVFKNLKGSFIFQQSLVFDWVPVRQSLYFFFSWMDSRFILSPSNFVVQSLKRVQTEPIPERCSPHKPVLRHTSGGRRCVFIEGRKRLFLKLIWSLMFESPDLSVRFAARSSTTTRLNRISYRLWENNSSSCSDHQHRTQLSFNSLWAFVHDLFSF